ncbi:MAG: hypothetical protein CES88_10885 [Halobacteriovorax sp. JY17]|nr:MAG: hypothetical protein CES88_10885 [Halobacteriovorax sp. JY17]
MFVGQRLNFTSSLEKELTSFFQGKKSLVIDFIDYNNFTTFSLSEYIRKQSPQIVIFTDDETKEIEKKVVRHLGIIGENRHTNYISLLNAGHNYKINESDSLTGEIIFFYKGIDHSDVFNFIVSMTASDLVEKSNVAKAIYTESLPLKNLAKITYLARDHAKIETNAELATGVIKLDFPIHKDVFLSHKYKISTGITDGTSAQFSYSYKMEFDYANAPIKKSEKDSIILNLKEKSSDAKLPPDLINTWEEQIKTSSIVIATTGNTEKKEVIKEVEEEDYYRVPPTEIINLAKTFITNWVHQNSSKVLGIQQTILVYDSKLSIANDIFQIDETNAKRIYLKADAVEIEKDIDKFKPSLIVLQCDDVNTVEDIKRAIASFINYRNYLPYFLIFNNPIADVVEYQHKLEYHFLISVGEKINLDFIEKVRNLFEKKMIESETNKSNRMKKKVQKAHPVIFDEFVDDDFYNYKVFPESLNIQDTFFIETSSELISITEHEIIFRGSRQPSLGTCFKITHPFTIYIVVVPHIIDSAENELKNCSRGIIFQMKEHNKARLRRFVNSVANLDTQSNSALYAKEIMALKKEYFPDSFSSKDDNN